MLLQAALEQELVTQSHKRSFVPDLSSLPAPLWTPRSERRKLTGKQHVADYVPPPSKRKVVRSHKEDVKLITWSDDEQRLIQEASDWRQKVRVQKRLLHNRTAQALSKHVVGPFQEEDDLVCAVCTKFSNLQRFFKEECGGEADRSNPVSEGGPRAMRASVCESISANSLFLHRTEKPMNLVITCCVYPQALDDEPRCVREDCLMTAPNGWRRFKNFASASCLGNP